MRTLRRLNSAPGLLRRASKLRKKMINASHAEDALKEKIDVGAYEREMPAQFRELYDEVRKSPEGKKALARYKKFWGIMPTEIRVLEMPGPKSKKQFLVGMGRAGQGGKIIDRSGRKTKAKGAKFVACDADGKRIYLLSGKNSGASQAKLKAVGVAEETHYVPTSAQEKAGTFKKNKYWVHRHDDEGGRFPRVYQDQAGNYIYGPGTYRVTDWIRR